MQVGSELPTCTRHGHRQLPEVVLTQFVSPDDEHDVLETCRVKNKNKYVENNCASCWSFSKNRYMMHGQQNIKKNCRIYTEKFIPNNSGIRHFRCVISTYGMYAVSSWKFRNV